MPGCAGHFLCGPVLSRRVDRGPEGLIAAQAGHGTGRRFKRFELNLFINYLQTVCDAQSWLFCQKSLKYRATPEK
jgi:hypothetical protein